MGQYQAGVARVTITPPVGMYLIGMERSDVSHGLRDDLFATALAVSDGAKETVIVSMDVLVINPKTVERIRQAASALTGIPGENIMFCATHCHSGPIMYSFEDSQPMVRGYMENFTHLVIGLIRMAHDNLAPARLGFGRGESAIGMNRRLTRPDGVTVIDAYPQGPVDHEVGILRVDRLDGSPLAVVVNYACHPVVLGNISNVISADWVGAMRRTVEKVTGAKVLFIQGASADINPWPGVPTDDEAILERLGLEIGGEVLKTFPSIPLEEQGEVQTACRKVWLPLMPLSEHAGKMPEFVELAGAVADLTFDQLQAWLHEYMPWSTELAGTGNDTQAALEMQSLRIGDLGIVAAGAEIFVKTGLEVKQRSPFENTIFAAYTNGCLSYIPLPEDYPRGGYEVFEAYLGYGLPAPVAPQSAGLVVQNALELLRQVS